MKNLVGRLMLLLSCLFCWNASRRVGGKEEAKEAQAISV